jgi:hypothetical protein
MADYLTMSDYDAYTHCGADARKWAEFFCQVAATHGLKIEPDWMQTWFANAMVAQVDFDQRAEVALLNQAKAALPRRT